MNPTAPITSFRHLVWLLQGACPGAGIGKFCGCSNPETVYSFIRDALIAAPWSPDCTIWASMPKGAAHLLASQLENLGLVEHGGSWFYAWLTPRGESVLAILRGLTDEQIASEYAACIEDVMGCSMEDCRLCAEFGDARFTLAHPDDSGDENDWVVHDWATGDNLGDDDGEIIYIGRENADLALAHAIATNGAALRLDIDRSTS